MQRKEKRKRKEESECGFSRYCETYTPIWKLQFQNFIQRLLLTTVACSSLLLFNYLLLEQINNVGRPCSLPLLFHFRSFPLSPSETQPNCWMQIYENLKTRLPIFQTDPKFIALTEATSTPAHSSNSYHSR